MGKKTSVALLTSMAGLGFVMMGCPPAEEAPPAGERIIQPAPPPVDPAYRNPPVETTPADPLPPPAEDPPIDPMPDDPEEPKPGDLPPPPPPGGS